MLIPGKVLHNETQRHVARMSTRNSAHIVALDTLIRSLVDAEIWNSIILLCVAGPSSSDSLLDLKGDHDSSLFGSPAFVANRGFTTVSTTALVELNYTMPYSLRDTGAYGMYIRNAPPAIKGTMLGDIYDEGGPSWPFEVVSDGVATIRNYIRTFIGGSRAISGGGFVCAGIYFAGLIHVTMADESLQSVNVSASALSASAVRYPLFLGCRNRATGKETPSSNQYACWLVGRELNPTRMGDLGGFINTYMTAIGAKV